MKFKYNPRIIRHLGTELITSDEIAITELIKNSYDARAKKVRIHFLTSLKDLDRGKLLSPLPLELEAAINASPESPLILLEDDGIGMSMEILENGFFEIGSDLKAQEKNNQSKSDQIILGDKGIGRLSAQRLSQILFVETTSAGDKQINVVKIDWNKSISSPDENAPEFNFPKSNVVSYTRLWFIASEQQKINFYNFFQYRKNIQIDFFENTKEIEGGAYYVKPDLQSALSFLYSPFEDEKSVLDLKIFFGSKPVTLDFNYDTLKIAESIHSFDTDIIKNEKGESIDLLISMKMEVRPWFIERIHQVELGKVLYQSRKLSHIGYSELLNKYIGKYRVSLQEKILLSELVKKWKLDIDLVQEVLKISPLKGKIFSFKRSAELMNNAVESAVVTGYISKETSINKDIRPFLDANNGIKLYRNKFRIGTIGNKDNDWLKLQQKRTSGQQFYRFELGNVIGFIKVNDFYQEYIYETSSREHLTDNSYVKALQSILEYIFEAFSPRFTKRAVDITKDILDGESLIPRNDAEDIKKEVQKSQNVLKAANENIRAIQTAFKAIDENISLDTEGQKEIIKKVLAELRSVSTNFEQNLGDAQRSFQSANKLIQIAEAEQKRIEVEAYNNYKLMANGLVTEVITHELHSLLSLDITSEPNELHFTALKQYLFKIKEFELNKMHLSPLKKKFDSLFVKMSDLNRFYSFLEKTFLYKGTSQDFEKVSVKSYLDEIVNRFDFRLNKNKIELDILLVDQNWVVPKGSLTHVFYNLIDNSIYWIQERQRRSGYDSTYKFEGTDRIVIKGVSDNIIHFYDTGTGVLAPYEHTLFNSLESGKENGGRGMGLYIIRNFLRSFGGDIELLSDRNTFNHRYIFEIKVKSSFSDDEDFENISDENVGVGGL
jgi:signal transduction histidine kinase